MIISYLLLLMIFGPMIARNLMPGIIVVLPSRAVKSRLLIRPLWLRLTTRMSWIGPRAYPLALSLSRMSWERKFRFQLACGASAQNEHGTPASGGRFSPQIFLALSVWPPQEA